MSVFLILAVLLSVLALSFILPPLLGKQGIGTAVSQCDEVNLAVLRDQLRELDADLASGTIEAGAYQSARHELAQRVAENVRLSASSFSTGHGSYWQAGMVSLALLMSAGSLYFFLGTPRGLYPAMTSGSNGQSDQLTQQQAEVMVERLAQHMKAQPDNAKGWLLLARSYTAMGRYTDAGNAYAELLKRFPDNPQWLTAQFFTDYADVLAMGQGKRLKGEPERLLKRALAVDPQNLNALVLIGSAEFERGDYGSAIVNWKKVAVLAPADSGMAQMVAGNIEEAKARIGVRPAMAGAVPPEARPPAAAAKAEISAQVSGTVELDPALRTQVSDTDTVFIFARAVEGPRFPLAVLRKQVRDLPATFVLDDSMSMIPGAKLSGFPLLVVGARISKSGNATPGSGDLEGLTSPVPPGTKGLKIRISTRRG